MSQFIYKILVVSMIFSFNIGSITAQSMFQKTIGASGNEIARYVYQTSAFTPNGDAVNDVFRVRGEGIETIEITIYDRWGEKIFESNDINNTWDGTYKGKLLNSGVFVYKLEVGFIDNQYAEYKGNITLLR